MTDFVLGTRYYTALAHGVSPKAVLSLPFILPENSFLEIKPAIAKAIELAETAFTKSDSLSERAKLEEGISLMKRGTFEEEIKRVVVFSSTWHMLRREPILVDLEAIPKPASYLLPAAEAWVAITPNTHYSLDPPWKPEAFFILKTEVKEVSWYPRGKRLVYEFPWTSYNPTSEQVCASEEAAKKLLCQLIHEQIPATPDPSRIRIYTPEDERQWRKQEHERLSALMRPAAIIM